MSSLKTIPEMFAFPPVQIPASPQWSNYWHVLNISYPVGRWFINSLIIVVLAVSGTVITASLVAYSFARFEYRGRNMLFMITLATMMLPAQVTLIPQFVLFYNWAGSTRSCRYGCRAGLAAAPLPSFSCASSL
ncbi:MAG: hypothetical protein R2911_38045 [Caldilineaceae bacterium]